MKKFILLAGVLGLAASQIASAADGKALWDQHHCMICHGPDGKGQTMIGKKLGIKDFTDPKVQKALTDKAAAKAIKDGIKNADGRQVMKPNPGLSDAQIKTLITYIRQFKK